MSATQKFFQKLFGQSGTRTAVPDAIQSDGTVSYDGGYGADYQRATGDALLKNIERDKFNQVLYDLTLGLQQYQTRGFPEFIAAADNGGAAYSYAKNAFVLWTDGNVYLSLINANTGDPTDSTKWRLFSPGADVGVILPFPCNTPPAGYLAADGSLLSRTSYPRLWAFAQASGNIAASDGVWTKGQFSPGDGATNFRIPDVRGYSMRYWDNGAGVDAGRALMSIQGDQNGAHTHGVNDPSHNHGHSDPGHAHAVNDPGHTHGLDHPFDSSTSGSNISGNGNGVQTTFFVNTAGTGIWLSGSGTGVTNVAAATSITIQSSGGTETRVKTLAPLGCIKFQ
jgi:microcystin-dependent protein